MNKHTLIIVGSGIKFMSHLTIEAKACIEKANKVLYLINEPAIEEWIKKSNPSSESLEFLYTKHLHRSANYITISNYIFAQLKKFQTLCFVTYGHPTVFDESTLYAANKANEQGYEVIIMPGISAENCLLADLRINPGSSGCQSFEATDFLIYRREYDASSHLILWQASVIGMLGSTKDHDPREGLAILANYLYEKYKKNHVIISYEAAQYPGFKPIINKIQLKNLAHTKIGRIATLYVPPNHKKKLDVDMFQKIKKLSFLL